MSFLALFLVCSAIYVGLWYADLAGAESSDPLSLMGTTGARDALANFGEVAVGTLAVALTVVAIIVELAANRYTPRITEMFVRDPVNGFVLSLFVVTSVLVVWVDMSLHGPVYPQRMVIAAVGLMSVSLLLLLPYFAYVFEFLEPTRVVGRIQARGQAHMRNAGPGKVRTDRDQLRRAIEQLGDVTLNSIEQRDKAIGIAAVNALAGLATHHVAVKAELPSSWFSTSDLVRSDVDFVAFHPDIVSALTERRSWVEMKVLRQYQAAVIASLHQMPDLTHLIAIRTRHLALAGAERRDAPVLDLSVRFLNTYMRTAINQGDIRAAYNLMNEYRVLGESLIRGHRDEEAVTVAEYVKYYGQYAFARNIPFILESAAYDLCGLLEFVHAQKAACHERLLTVFLDVDREPEGEGGQEAALRGVRKAQVKLATYYLAAGEERFARRIFRDMCAEPKTRLYAIRDELLAVDEPEFWEVSDRGINFEYLAPERRAQLDTFYAWFEEPGGAGEGA